MQKKLENVYKGGFRVNSKPSVDWILESKIKKNSAIFVIEDKIDKKFLEEIKSKNYSYYICTNKTPSRELNLNWLIKLIFYYPFIILNKIPNLIFSNLLIKEIVVHTYINYFKWNIFNSNYKPKVYFSYHNYETMHILRNIILNKNDCSSIMYKHTFSENVFDESNNYNNVSQGFNFHQKEFHWGKSSVEMAKKDKNESEKLEIIGPIWTSEHFMKEKQSNIENKNLNNIILSAFSTGFDNFGAVNDIETHINFILFLDKILKLKKNYKIIYKPKFNMKWAKERNIEFFNFLKKMEMNENFSIIGDEISTKIIERSDIVISMPFASTTVEALALKRKSFFVDLKNNFPNSMYKNYDGLVANSEDQAFKKLEFWVNMNQENFLKYYNDKISDIFDKVNNTFAANKIINQVNDLMK